MALFGLLLLSLIASKNMAYTDVIILEEESQISPINHDAKTSNNKQSIVVANENYQVLVG